MSTQQSDRMGIIEQLGIIQQALEATQMSPAPDHRHLPGAAPLATSFGGACIYTTLNDVRTLKTYLESDVTDADFRGRDLSQICITRKGWVTAGTGLDQMIVAANAYVRSILDSLDVTLSEMQVGTPPVRQKEVPPMRVQV